MTTITAVFEVKATSIAYWPNVSVANPLDLDRLAEQLEGRHPGVDLCPQCTHLLGEPEIGELMEFTVNGIRYTKGGHSQWERSS